jgi:hypothetical protein
MLRLFFTSSIFVLIVFSVNVKAQNTEEISELTPFIEWCEKVSKDKEKKDCKSKNIFPKNYFKDNIIDDFEQINFTDNYEIKKLENGESIVSIKIITTYNEFVFEDVGEKPRANIRYFCRIISKDKKFDSVFEDLSILTSDLQEIVKNKNQIINYQKSFKLPKGKYSILFMINDRLSGNRGIKTFKLEIK